MRIDKDAGTRAPIFLQRSANSVRLPKFVCFLGKESTQGELTSPSVYEFEVVTGNAAYQEGERFYLTRAEAERAYFSGGLNA